MIINSNIPALNTYRQMGQNNDAASKSMEKLSSGLRINRAGDDAAGLAISEKMRAQVRGLDQASRNSQDGISMIQTAEGALQETHNILQRMRELATQASNDTNVEVDRNEIQKEMNALTSEINRIGETTEFNTQKILKGDGQLKIDKSSLFTSDVSVTGTDVQHTQASATVTFSAAAAVDTDALSIDLNGITLTATFATNDNTLDDSEAYNVTGSSATINIAGTADVTTSGDGYANALNAMIEANDVLKGNYEAVSDGAGVVTISAVKGGAYEGAAGTISGYTETVGTAANFTEDLTNATGSTTAATTAATNLDFTDATGLSVNTQAEVEALVGKGLTINGQQVEFYNANDGAYTGEAFGVNLSDAINATANWDQALAKTVASQLNTLEGITATETAANSGIVQIATTATGSAAELNITDGGVQSDFTAKFQIGANQGQSMQINIADMRANALGVSGKTSDQSIDVENAEFTATSNVTNGTDNNNVEYALDVSSHESAAAAVTVINNAIESVSAERSNLGAFQNRLEHTISNLGNSSENLQAAESRVRDVDMAKEVMEMTRANILGQASQAMLAQANQKPQSVLQLLG